MNFETEVTSNNAATVDISVHVINDTPDRYELPPRSTRGIPPKLYDPEYEAQRSRYPISRDSDKNLSQTAMAYNVAIYSNTVLRNIEEALQDPN